jgi:sporulation protein YlmC with PRC-barrel domain
MSMILTVAAFTAQREAVAWGLPPGFNPETGKIEKTSETPGVCKANDLVGMTVKSAWGDRFGSVEEVTFADNDTIEYLIITRGDEAESDERLVPIPWETAKARVRKDRIILSMSKGKFENAPSFSRSDWEKLSDPEWNKTVHSYYESREKAKGEMTEGTRPEHAESTQMCVRHER